MNRHKQRRVFCVALAVTAATLSVPPMAAAWGPVNRHHPNRSSNPGIWSWRWSAGGSVCRPYTETQMTHRSSDPAAYHAGDVVTVAVDEARIMRGTQTLGILSKGRKFTVTKTERGWLGAKIEVDGKPIDGWIWSGHVSMAMAEPRVR